MSVDHLSTPQCVDQSEPAQEALSSHLASWSVIRLISKDRLVLETVVWCTPVHKLMLRVGRLPLESAALLKKRLKSSTK